MQWVIILTLITVAGADMRRFFEKCQPAVGQQESIHSEGGQLLLRYESPEGTKVSEHGILKPKADGSGNVLVKKGSVQYISPEGTPFTLSYIADELGYRVKSDSLPVAPISANSFYHV